MSSVVQTAQHSTTIKLQAMPHRQSTEGNDKELLFERALAGLKSEEYSSIYSAAKSLGISKATLGMRVNGRQPQAKAHVREQNLSESEEQCLAKWITSLTEYSSPPSYRIIREMAEAIRQDRVTSINEASIEYVSYPPLGKCWVQNFIKRHPQLKGTYARRIDAARVDQSTGQQCRR